MSEYQSCDKLSIQKDTDFEKPLGKLKLTKIIVS